MGCEDKERRGCVDLNTCNTCYNLIRVTTRNWDTGDTVIVTATKGTSAGINSGIVQDSFPGVSLNIAIVNVVIPEFGVITAFLALFGVGSVFIYHKRKHR